CALASTTRPAPNNAMPVAIDVRGPTRSTRDPASTMPTTSASRYAVKDQPYSDRPCSDFTTVGMIVATAIASTASTVMTTTTPARVRRCNRLDVSTLGSTAPTVVTTSFC